jgi:glycosyltransferase involved in cell wall biosynthesis
MICKLRIVHVINSFEFGGAEAMLCNLLLRTDRNRFDLHVVSLIDDLTVARPVLNAGIPIVTMGMKPGVPDPRGVTRLARHLRQLRPHVVQTWMDHSNLIGGLAAIFSRCPGIVWGIHHCDHVPSLTKRSTLMTVQACAALSRKIPSQIVCCSNHAAKTYARRGFASAKMLVIPNGIDTQIFRPDPDARISVRRELALAPDTPLIGLIARYDPLKDHANFLRAAPILASRRPEAHFVLCGANVDATNAALTKQIHELGLAERCHLLGPRRDIPRIQAALDLATSSSISEAFPLVLGEAMACAVPCVATHVGDCAWIIGQTGRIVPPRDPQALADAWADLLRMTPQARADLGRAARERVRESFGIDQVTRRYETLYERIGGADILVCPEATLRTVAPPIDRTLPRVLMIVESAAGGTGRHVLDLCQGLLARGCDVHLVYSTVRIDPLFKHRLTQFKHLPTLALPIRTAPHFTDLAALRAIRQHIRRNGPFDIIHGHSSKGGALARLAALGTRAKAFYTLHGLIMMDPDLARPKSLFYRAIELLLSFRTSRIIAVSPEESRAAIRVGLGRHRVQTIPNGVDAQELTPRARARRNIGLFDDEAIVIGFVGRLVTQKAPQILLRAFALATRVAPNLRLAIVGSGPLEPALRRLADQQALADKVLWLGERDARTVLAALDVFATSSRKEGLPYVVLEAMAAGLPIVATNSAGVEILVEPNVNGVVVPRDAAAALGLALIGLASDPQRRAAFAQASRRRAARFTLDAMVDQTLAAYIAATKPTSAPVSPRNRLAPAPAIVPIPEVFAKPV